MPEYLIWLFNYDFLQLQLHNFNALYCIVRYIRNVADIKESLQLISVAQIGVFILQFNYS